MQLPFILVYLQQAIRLYHFLTHFNSITRMAILRGGLHGNARKSVGGITYRTRGTTTVASQKVDKPKNPRTIAQQTHRYGFKVLNGFLAKFRPLVSILVQEDGDWSTSFSAFQKRSKTAVDYISPTQADILSQNVSFGGGNMENVIMQSPSNTGPGTIAFTWDNNTVGVQTAGDRVSVFAIPKDPDQYAGVFGAEQFDTGASNLLYPTNLSGETVAIYAINYNINTQKQGTLQHLGDYQLQ